MDDGRQTMDDGQKQAICMASSEVYGIGPRFGTDRFFSDTDRVILGLRWGGKGSYITKKSERNLTPGDPMTNIVF